MLARRDTKAGAEGQEVALIEAGGSGQRRANLPVFWATRRRARPTALARAGLFLWVPVWLSVGIALWFASPWEPGALFYALAAMGAPAAALFGWRSSARDLMRLAALAVALILAGALISGLRAHSVAAPVLAFRYYGPIEGRVIGVDRSGSDRLRVVLDQVTLERTTPERTPARVRLSLMTGEPPEIGARVRVTGNLGPPPGPAAPAGFDFRRYAWFQGLGAIGYVRNEIEVIVPAVDSRWQAGDRLRIRASQGMQDQIGGQAGAVAAALMTGDRSGISAATNEAMRASNLYHIVSISGLHMGMLSGFVYAGARLFLLGLGMVWLRAMNWPVHKYAAGVALLAAAIYLWISGGGVATERAFLMVSVMLCAILADRRAISLRSVALAAVVLLIVAPEGLLSAGFQMSFTATIALILSFGPWQAISPRIPPLIRPVAMLIFSSAVAGFATAPIAAAHFGRYAEYGLLANLLAVPVMGTLVMPAGVLAGIAALIGLEPPFLWVMGLGTRWMLFVADFVTSLDGASRAVPAPPGVVLPLLGLGAVLAVLWGAGRKGRARWLRSTPGMALITLGFFLWAVAPRPFALIAPQGDAVGVMTSQGRALSKPSGGKFSATSWLEEDGDLAGMAAAAARPLWSGPRQARVADVGQGWRIVHLTGKSAPDHAVETCQPKVILVSNQRLPQARRGGCLLLDQWVLRWRGAAELRMSADGPQITHALREARLWEVRPRRARKAP